MPLLTKLDISSNQIVGIHILRQNIIGTYDAEPLIQFIQTINIHSKIKFINLKDNCIGFGFELNKIKHFEMIELLSNILDNKTYVLNLNITNNHFHSLDQDESLHSLLKTIHISKETNEISTLIGTFHQTSTINFTSKYYSKHVIESTVDYLNYCNYGLTSIDAIFLGNELIKHKTNYILDLSNNYDFNDLGVENLVTTLLSHTTNTQMTELKLNNCGITSVCFKYLNLLFQKHSIIKLEINQNPQILILHPSDVISLPLIESTSLTDIDLSCVTTMHSDYQIKPSILFVLLNKVCITIIFELSVNWTFISVRLFVNLTGLLDCLFYCYCYVYCYCVCVCVRVCSLICLNYFDIFISFKFAYN